MKKFFYFFVLILPFSFFACDLFFDTNWTFQNDSKFSVTIRISGESNSITISPNTKVVVSVPQSKRPFKFTYSPVTSAIGYNQDDKNHIVRFFDAEKLP